MTSLPGETTFRLTLPPEQEGAQTLSAGRILVVDDEPQIRRIMRTTLTGAGYEVDDAKTGEEALEKVREFRPDLVLLDINMPGMGGLAACRAMRADPNIAIIMLTVRNTEKDKVEALDAGADDFVVKPFSTPELLARIRAALRRCPCAPVIAGQASCRTPGDRLRGANRDERSRDVPPDAERTRPASIPDATRDQSRPAPGTPAGCLGPRLRRSGGLSSRVHQEPSKEDRDESGSTRIHYD